MPGKTADWNKYLREYRARKVAAGLCGMCFKPRGKFAFLCDSCAEKHRERQRRKRLEKKSASREVHWQSGKLFLFPQATASVPRGEPIYSGPAKSEG